MNSTSFDALIVLGRSLNADDSIENADAERLTGVADLYTKGLAKKVIVCGSHGYKSRDATAKTEAEAYAAYLQNSGVPQGALLLENESKESLGNILFAKMNILIPHNLKSLLVIPTVNHSSARIEYLLAKILGNDYSWEIQRFGENNDPANAEREERALALTKEINDAFKDGDHEAIYNGLMATHPAYGGTRWTLDELREKMKPVGREDSFEPLELPSDEMGWTDESFDLAVRYVMKTATLSEIKDMQALLIDSVEKGVFWSYARYVAFGGIFKRMILLTFRNFAPSAMQRTYNEVKAHPRPHLKRRNTLSIIGSVLLAGVALVFIGIALYILVANMFRP